MNTLPQQLVSHATIVMAVSGMLVLSTLGCASEDTGADAVAAKAEPTGTQPGGTDAMNATPGGPADPAPIATNTGGTSTSTGPVNAPSAGTTAPGPTASNPVVGPGGAGGEVVGMAGSGGTGAIGGTGGEGSGAGGTGNGGTNNGGPGSAGAAGTGVGGDAPVGGAAGVGDDPMPSTGCGATPPASERYSIDVDGLMREYILAVPEDYDPAKAYRLIFAWHPWGGSAQQVAGNGGNGYYGLLGASDGEAILVSPEGLDFGGNGLGWGNEGGQDIDFLRAMLDRFDGELCFDHNRVFSTGFSFGGMMSNAVACAGLARAVAPMAGNASVAGCDNGTQPVAYMGFHGDADTVVAPSGGEAARDTFVERNGCGAEIASDSDWCDLAGDNYQPCTCTTYEGCQDGYPVTWCKYAGGHMVAPNSGETVWNFFAQF